jgi:hypothetical protein
MDWKPQIVTLDAEKNFYLTIIPQAFGRTVNVTLYGENQYTFIATGGHSAHVLAISHVVDSPIVAIRSEIPCDGKEYEKVRLAWYKMMPADVSKVVRGYFGSKQEG